MFFLTLLFVIVANASCLPADGEVQCSDDSGLLLCLRAQDRVNWLIDTINETIPYLSLNCTQHVISNDRKWQSNVRLYVHYSTQNNAACYRALKIFADLTKTHLLSNVLPIEYETIEGSKDYSAASTLKTIGYFVPLFYLFAIN